MRQVNMKVVSPSRIELRAQEKVRLDRVHRTETGEAEIAPHGALIPPGTHEIALDPGVYHFRHVNDAALRVVHGGVAVESGVTVDDKDPWPESPGFPLSRGEGPCGPVPNLVIEASPERDER